MLFKEKQTMELIEYLQNRYNTKIEFLWENSPDCAAFRRADNKKWYGVLMIISKTKLGLDESEKVEIVDLRNNTEMVADYENVFPGYHMNKKSWITIPLDGRMPTEQLFEYIDQSYNLAKK